MQITESAPLRAEVGGMQSKLYISGIALAFCWGVVRRGGAQGGGDPHTPLGYKSASFFDVFSDAFFD